MAALLQESGYQAVEKPNRASVLIVNTCGFINDAKEESIETILRYAEAKKSGIIGKVYVMGCLSQRYRKELEAELLEVDGFYGVNDLPVILKDLGGLFQNMYLAATAMGLAPCAIGIGNSDLFARATGIDYYAEGSVGEFVLGSRK